MLEWILKIFAGIYGVRCPSCSNPSDNFQELCSKCRSELKRNDRDLCPKCGKTRLAELGFCLRCRHEEPAYEKAESLFVYGEVPRNLLWQFKKNGSWFAAFILAGWLKNALDKMNKNLIIIPIPGNKKTNRVRGFDPMQRLLKIARVKKYEHVLRMANRGSRKDQGLIDRKRNTIIWTRGKVPKHCLLIDDMRTTDTTINQASLALLRGGALSVNVLTIFAD